MSVATSAPPVPARKGRSRNVKRLYVAGAVVAVAIGFLIFKGVTSAFVFFKTADQALADRSTLGNSTFDIEGSIVPGTIVRPRSESQPITFSIESNKAVVEVSDTGIPPQLFGYGIPVVLVGHFIGSTNRFYSQQILVKHSNSYIAAHPARVRASNGLLH